MARIPLVPSELGLGATPNDGTGSQLRVGGQVIRDWMDDINAMTGELYEGEYAPRYVQFGAGNVKDMLNLAFSAGTLADTYRMRAIIKGKIVFDNPGTGHPMYQGVDQATTAYNQLMLSMGSTAKTVTIGRDAVAATVGQAASKLGPAVVSGGGNTLNVGDEFILIASYNAGDGIAIQQVYKNGATSPSWTAQTAGNAVIALSGFTYLSIGGCPDPVSAHATAFYRGKLSEVRLWLTSACSAVKLATANTNGTTPVLSGSGTSFTVSANTTIAAGTVLTNTSASNSTATVTSNTAGAIVTGAWSGAGVTAADVLTYSTETFDAAQLQAVLADEDPGATGAIGGVAPEVYFGRGQLPSEWNAGANMGTLNPATWITTGNIT
jgi:hypothetical protein